MNKRSLDLEFLKTILPDANLKKMNNYLKYERADKLFFKYGIMRETWKEDYDFISKQIDKKLTSKVWEKIEKLKNNKISSIKKEIEEQEKKLIDWKNEN
jgi:hypothetical protein